MDINDYNWHDQIIKNIIINRENPGECDIIEFEIEWEDDTVSTLVFQDVYWANLSLNFGIIAPESIYTAYMASDCDPDLCECKDAWKRMMGKEMKGLKMYVFELNSTGGVIKIIAKNIELR